MVQFKTLRKGHAITLNHKLHLQKRDPTCNSPSLYTSPSNGDTIKASQQFTITWDTSYASCLPAGTTNVDIYLLSPSSSDGHVKIFSSIPFTAGTYSKNLNPSWWGGADETDLTINMAPSGEVLAFSPFAAGPVIKVQSDGVKPSGDLSDSSDPTLKTTGDVAQGGGLPKGSVAAAVLIPIIAILVALGFYVKISRKKQAERMRRFSQNMNARMSRISGDWQTQGNEKFGVRSSTVSGMRMSNVFGNDMQMDSREDGSRVSIANIPYSPNQPIGSRTARFNPPSVGTRQSRISFAPEVNASKERLSTYSTGRGSRAFPADDAPPVPRADFDRSSNANPLSVASASVYDVNSIYAIGSHEQHEDANVLMSPTQTTGPATLSNEDINNIDIAPALSMMRTGNPATKSSEDLLMPPVPPTPTHSPGGPASPLGSSFNAPPLSPLGTMPMQAQQAAVAMSPDDMLRQYAKTKAKNPLGYSVSTPSIAYAPTSPSTPLYTAAGMRNLTGDADV